MKNTLVVQSWDDLVFEDRNKEYGAYQIRKKYVNHATVGIVIAVLVAVLVLLIPTIAKLLESPEPIVEAPKRTMVYSELQAPPPIKNTPPPPKFDIPPLKKVIKFVPPKVTKEEVPEDVMPTVEEMKDVQTAAVEVEGTGEVVFDEPVQEVVADGGGDKVEQVFTVVEQMPEYSGGYEAMMKFISKNIKYPASARRMGIEGQVFVSFVVDTEGKISEVQTIKGISADCDKEAVRVVQLMPPWKAGKQNGKPVKVRFVLPIKFKLGT